MKGSTVEADHHGNNLALGHLRFPVSPFRYVTCLRLVIPGFHSHILHKIVGNTKYFNNCLL